MRQVKALIFDMDGLMVDTERLYWDCEYQLAREAGKELSEETLYAMMGRKPLESMGIFCHHLGLEGSPEEWLERRNQMMRQKLEQELAAMPGLEDIIHEFRAQISLAVATGAQQPFLDLVVDKLGLRGHFDVMLSSETVAVGKPDPETYLKVCAQLGYDPEACIVLEDSENGCRAARAANCITVAVPTDYTREQDFSMVDYIARDLQDAGHIIHKIMGTV